MHTNLTKVGGKWAIEVIGGPDEETLVKTFDAREDATNWVRRANIGQVDAPVLKKKGEAKAKPAKKAKTVKK